METKPKIYTEAFVKAETESLLKTLKENEGIVYLGELFIDKDYTRSRFHEWANEYSDNEQISCTIKAIKEILETRAIV